MSKRNTRNFAILFARTGARRIYVPRALYNDTANRFESADLRRQIMALDVALISSPPAPEQAGTDTEATAR